MKMFRTVFPRTSLVKVTETILFTSATTLLARATKRSAYPKVTLRFYASTVTIIADPVKGASVAWTLDLRTPFVVSCWTSFQDPFGSMIKMIPHKTNKTLSG